MKEALRQLGPALTLLYACHRLLVSLSSGRCRIVPYALYAQPLGSGAYAGVRDGAETVVAEVTPDDPLVASFPRPARVLAERWHSGSRCLAARVKGSFGGYIWLSQHQHHEDEVRCHYVLPVDAVWDFDVYVPPTLRLGRTLGRLWKAVDAQLVAEGRRWSFSRISRFNPGSVSTHERLGARRVGLATFVVMGPLQVAWLTQPPYLRASLRAGPGPCIRLQAPAAADQAG